MQRAKVDRERALSNSSKSGALQLSSPCSSAQNSDSELHVYLFVYYFTYFTNTFSTLTKFDAKCLFITLYVA